MNNLMYISFFLFIIAAYFYYQKKGKKKDLYYKEKRDRFLFENSELTDNQSQNLSKGLPWVGMESSMLIDLFGEPRRKRVLDGSMTRIIWSYTDLFIYLNENKVVEWKNRE